MNWTDIEEDLKRILTPKRFTHTQNVVEAAEKLAHNFGCDPRPGQVGSVAA
jgi:Predicted HD superfamily hydrolase involved in NAD metabolism